MGWVDALDLEMSQCGCAEQRQEGRSALLVISEAPERATWSCLVTWRDNARDWTGRSGGTADVSKLRKTSSLEAGV